MLEYIGEYLDWKWMLFFARISVPQHNVAMHYAKYIATENGPERCCQWDEIYVCVLCVYLCDDQLLSNFVNKINMLYPHWWWLPGTLYHVYVLLLLLLWTHLSMHENSIFENVFTPRIWCCATISRPSFPRRTWRKLFNCSFYLVTHFSSACMPSRYAAHICI